MEAEIAFLSKTMCTGELTNMYFSANSGLATIGPHLRKSEVAFALSRTCKVTRHQSADYS